MSSPTFYTDGTPAYGTQTITINATTYLAENITINRPVAEAEDFTANGTPARKRVTALRANGTMSLQASAGTAGKPQMGQTFTLTSDDNFGAETFVLKEVGVEENNDAGTLRKMPVTFDKVVSSITTFTTT